MKQPELQQYIENGNYQAVIAFVSGYFSEMRKTKSDEKRLQFYDEFIDFLNHQIEVKLSTCKNCKTDVVIVKECPNCHMDMCIACMDVLAMVIVCNKCKERFS